MAITIGQMTYKTSDLLFQSLMSDPKTGLSICDQPTLSLENHQDGV